MATVKIVLRKKKNKDGSYPLALRITKDRASSFIHLGHHIKESEWDDIKKRVRKSHPNSTRLNNKLLKELSKANEKALEMEDQKGDISSKAVRQGLKSTKGATFFSQAAIYIDNLKKSGKYNSVVAEEPRIKRFKEFLKGEEIGFQEITVPLLNRYKAYLKSPRQLDERTIVMKERTVVNHLLIIRTIFNQAIKSSIVDQKYYPFGKGKISIKFPESIKIGLNPEEVKMLEDVSLKHAPFLNHARNIWLFAFYFAGMRVSDILRLKWSDFQNDRLHYSMGKNSKVGSLKVPEKALKILSQYKQQKNKNQLVFPELNVLDELKNSYEVQRKISYAVKKLDQALTKVASLAGIEKKLTMHIARHTFGNISGERIPLQMLQKLYRHSSITTTIGYQANFIHKDADEALDAVVGF